MITLIQVPDGNNAVNAQAAADAAAAQPLDPAADVLAPANPHEAGNQRDGAELDDDDEDDDGEEDDEEEEEEGREEDAADANNGGQGQCWHKNTELVVVLLCFFGSQYYMKVKK